jgi:hypothetical protein
VSGVLTLDGVTYDVTPRAVVTPPPPPPPPATGRHRIVWHQGWRGPALGSWPVDVRAGITAVCIDMCQSAQAGTGKLTAPPGVTRAEILALTGAGVDVFAGIGGSGGAGITVTNTAQAADVVTSVLGFATSLGITGAVWDLETAPGDGWTTGAVSTASQLLVNKGLRVGICSATYGGRLAAWGTVARALGGGLHSWQRMFYDFPQARTSELTKIVADDFTAMRGYVTADQQLVGAFMPTDPGDANTSPVPVLSAAYRAARAARPDVGWAMYHDATDAAAGWTATRALMAS